MNDKVIKLIPTEQHAKIKGYRKLSDVEIALMNRIKSLEADFTECAIDVNTHLSAQAEAANTQAEQARIVRAGSSAWYEEAVRNVHTGLMQLIRAVAQPECQLYLRDVAEFEAKLATGDAAYEDDDDHDIIEQGDGYFSYRFNYEELPEDGTDWAIHPKGTDRWHDLNAILQAGAMQANEEEPDPTTH